MADIQGFNYKELNLSAVNKYNKENNIDTKISQSELKEIDKNNDGVITQEEINTKFDNLKLDSKKQAVWDSMMNFSINSGMTSMKNEDGTSTVKQYVKDSKGNVKKEINTTFGKDGNIIETSTSKLNSKGEVNKTETYNFADSTYSKTNINADKTQETVYGLKENNKRDKKLETIVTDNKKNTVTDTNFENNKKTKETVTDLNTNNKDITFFEKGYKVQRQIDSAEENKYNSEKQLTYSEKSYANPAEHSGVKNEIVNYNQLFLFESRHVQQDLYSFFQNLLTVF